jgi:hypothetical protein
MAFGTGFTGNLTENNVSIKQWLVPIGSGWGSAGSGMTFKAENRYDSIRERILSRGSAYQLPAGVTLTGNDLNEKISYALSAGNEQQANP